MPLLIAAFTLISSWHYLWQQCQGQNNVLLHHNCWGGRSYTTEIKLSQSARYSQISNKYRLVLAWYHCILWSKHIISWSNHMTSLFIHHLSAPLGSHLPEEHLCLHSCFPRCCGDFSYLHPIHQSHVTTCWKRTLQCWTNFPQSLLWSAGRQQQIKHNSI